MFITIIIKQADSLSGQFTMKMLHISQLCRKLAVIPALALLIFLLFESSFLMEAAKGISEPEKYLHSFVDVPPYGNWTFIEKPVFPVYFNNTQIPVGSNWTIICPLTANHTYHIYCYGEWIDYGPNPLTDYDIYVYNPLGELESYHTESAGFPEHLGTTANETFFVPKYSSNYTFVVRNDPRESIGAQQATFMIIENIECNVWYEHFARGKEGELSVLETSWAYEFVTESRHVEVLVRVPETLDMYEVRLYLMADPEAGVGSVLNDVPLALEAGLHGVIQGIFGGYNLESEEYRGIAYGSCEFHGQDMFLNFTSPHLGESLYHLVFIGETGSGTVEFLVKTESENACIKPQIIPQKVYPHNDTVIAYNSNSTDLKNGVLQYSINEWRNVTALEMDIVNNRTCTAVIPGQSAGTFVNYRIEAIDVLENVLVAYGNYSVKYPSALNLSSTSETVHLGENITVRGQLTPPDINLPVTVYFTSANESKQIVCYTLENGTFTASFRSETLETWKARAKFSEGNLRYGNVSSEVTIKVEEPPLLVKYGLYIGVGVGIIAVMGSVIYWRKSKG